MADNIIQSKLISKYLLNNNSIKTSETAKTSGASSSTTATGKTQTNSLSDILDLSSLNADQYVYSYYNAQGQYETMPTLVDYLNDNDSDSSSDLFGNTSSTSTSLTDYLSGSSSSDSDSYDSMFGALADAMETQNNLLIQKALDKIQEDS